MARYERQDSHVVFQPAPLTLTTNKHRASLEGNETSLLTGINPRRYGAYGRMPGGRWINAASVTGTKPSQGVFRSKFFNTRGLRNGHVPFAKVTSALGAASLQTWTVDRVQGFEVGDSVSIFDTLDYQNQYRVVAFITVIDPANLKITTQAGALDSDGLPDGSSVGSNTYMVRNIGYFRTGSGSADTQLQAGDTSHSASGVYVMMFSDIAIGEEVYIVSTNDPTTENTATKYQIKSFTMSASSAQINWSPALPQDKIKNVTAAAGESVLVGITPIVPPVSLEKPTIYLTYDDARIWAVKGSDSAQPTWDGVYDTSVANSPWSMCPMDRQLGIFNGNSEPTRITEVATYYDSSVSGQEDPLEPIGFPESGIDDAAYYRLVGTGGMTEGVHTVFMRFLDRSVIPTAKSPPVNMRDITITGSNETIEIDCKSTMEDLLYGEGLIHRAYRKATHFEVWMTPEHDTSSVDFYLVDTGHISHLIYNGATVIDAYYGQRWKNFISPSTGGALSLSITDEALLSQLKLDHENDLIKNLPPNGKHIHCSQDITYIGGKTSAGAVASEYPTLAADNVVHFSREDVSEPENFPPDNARIVGVVGDQIMGFVSAGDLTVILSRFSYTTAQRAGTFISWRDGDVFGAGCAYEDAYVSLGSHAAWVSDERIWLFNGRTQESPKDVGFPIRDWVQGLRDNKEVRMGYDPSNYMMWVGTRKQDDTCECRVYSFEEDTWVAMDDLWLAAPTTAFGMFNDTATFSDSSRLYRFPGSPPTMHSVVDFYDKPVNHCFQTTADTTNFTLSGLVSAHNNSTVTTTLGDDTNLTLFSVSTENPLLGQHIRFIETDGTEHVGIITVASATDITFTPTLSVPTTSSFIICGIPYRLRYPVIRGQDVFTKKIVRGAQFLIDDVNVSGQGATESLTVSLLRNFKDTIPSGASESRGTLDLVNSNNVAARDSSQAVDVSATGKTIELEVKQVDAHVDFSLIYGACRVSIPGPLNEDRSSTV